jgi:hypothetical protein
MTDLNDTMTARVDAAMTAMRNIVPPLRRSECEQLIRAALAAAPASLTPAPQGTASDDWLQYYAQKIEDEAEQHSDEFADIMRAIAEEMKSPAASLTQAATSEPVAAVVDRIKGMGLIANEFMDSRDADIMRKGFNLARTRAADIVERSILAAPVAHLSGTTPNTEAPSVKTWQGLNDVQWMNIVNHDHAYNSFTKDEAIHEAVKRTEAKLRELNAALCVQQAGVQEAPSEDDSVIIREWLRQYTGPGYLQAARAADHIEALEAALSASSEAPSEDAKEVQRLTCELQNQRELVQTWKGKAVLGADYQDAKRYRFLRHADLDEVCARHWPDREVPEGEELDRIIDEEIAALASQGVKGEEQNGDI